MKTLRQIYNKAGRVVIQCLVATLLLGACDEGTEARPEPQNDQSPMPPLASSLPKISLPPSVKDMKFTVPSSGFFIGKLQATDPNGDALTYSPDFLPKLGDLKIQPDGTFTYLPHSGYLGQDTFGFLVSDGESAPTKGKATLNFAGSLDLSFGKDGVTSAEGGVGTNYFGGALVIQPNRRMVLLKNRTLWGPDLSSDDYFQMRAFQPNGTLDSTFGNSGIVEMRELDAYAYDFKSLADGSLIVAGRSKGSGSAQQDLSIWKFDSNGSLDTHFGSGGIIRENLGSTISNAKKVVILSDSRILILAEAYPQTKLILYQANGSLDNSFGVNGIATVNGFTFAYALSVQNDGRILVGGEKDAGAARHLALRRFNVNGSNDPSFGVDGLVTTPIEGGSPRIQSLALQSDGKIVAAAKTYLSVYPNPYILHFVRYDTNGLLDNSFGLNGIVTTVWEVSSWSVSSILIQQDGKILVSGEEHPPENNLRTRAVLARYETNGTLDNGFGIEGKSAVEYSKYNSSHYAMQMDNDGTVVVAGEGISGHPFVLARFFVE